MGSVNLDRYMIMKLKEQDKLIKKLNRKAAKQQDSVLNDSIDKEQAH